MIFISEFFLFLLIMPHRFILIPAAFLLVAAAGFLCHKASGKLYSAKEILHQPFSLKFIALCIVYRAARIFYTRWKYSIIVSKISGFSGIKASYLTLITALILAVLSFCAVLFFLSSVLRLISRNKYLKKAKLPAALSAKNDSPWKSAAAATVYCALFYLSQSMLTLWSTSDNYRISLILNGVYSDNDNYCVFIHHWICAAVKFIDRIFPSADGFVLLSEFLILAGLWCIFYLASKNLRRISALSVFFGICLVNYDVNLLHMAFTLTAMTLTGIGFILIYSYIKHKSGLPFLFIGSVLFIFGCLWRYSAHIMALPFAALLIAADIFDLFIGRKEKKHFLIRLAVCLVPLLIICGWTRSVSENFNKTSEKYKPGISYNAYRSQMCDYPVTDYENVSDELSEFGISENDYLTVKSLILFDTDRIDTGFLKNLANSTRQSAKGKLNVFIESGMKNTLNNMKSDISFYYTVFLIYAFFLILIIAKGGSTVRIIEYIAALMGSASMIVYFTYAGHLPGYLLKGLSLCPLLILFDIFILDGGFSGKVSGRRVAAFMAAVLILTFSAESYRYFKIYTKDIRNTSFTAKNFDKTYPSQTELAGIDSSEDAVFIWSVYEKNTVLYGEMFSDGKLADRDYLTHNLLDGEWIYNQPYFNDLLSTAGINNPAEALTSREHTYYIAPEARCSYALRYIQEHFDPKAEVVKVGTVHGFPVWSFNHAER